MKRLAITVLGATALALGACSGGESAEGQEATANAPVATETVQDVAAPEPTATTEPEATPAPTASATATATPRATASTRATPAPKPKPTARQTAAPQPAEQPKAADCTPEHREMGHC